ncbi:proline iminopeptidase [Azospirillum sp. RU38E]|nr:proline iminopeptidase [Azospirillum sp. RU38E]SNS01027.1 proline iminopeptidase [Azospirillum sp. RU37A]
MRVMVNGAPIWFDVEGAKLVPDGETMRARPTLILLHGGPGFDHASFKPAFGALADVAQVIYIDHRGQGRSGGDDPATWTLAQWADDVKGFCDALEIEKPYVLGNSFGGFVAQAYMERHPGHAAGVILSSTAARMRLDLIINAFDRRAGADVAAAARDFWTDVRADKVAAYSNSCMGCYTVNPAPGGIIGRARSIVRPQVLEHFSGPDGEMWGMDFRKSLGKAQSPVLVLAGDDDPITPWEAAEELIAHLPKATSTLKRFAACGHGTFRDQPAGTFDLLREFMQV